MTADIPALEPRLAVARERTSVASRKMGAEYRAARYAQLAAERDLALARGEPACTVIAWEAPWDTGAPSPHVIAGGGNTYLIYLVAERDAT